jgi:hypothetical protein
LSGILRAGRFRGDSDAIGGSTMRIRGLFISLATAGLLVGPALAQNTDTCRIDAGDPVSNCEL